MMRRRARLEVAVSGVRQFILAAALPLLAPSVCSAYQLTLVDRILYGPGPLPDQKLGHGHVKNMEFPEFMHSTVAAFNNGGDEPNVSGEALQGTPVDGRMADGTLINESIDMGNAVIMNGQFNLLLGAVYGGPNQGNSRFFLDSDYNWTIQDDIAIDPGIPEAVIKINNFVFSTGPRVVPYSIQTERKYPGGFDRVGSLQSGDVIVGRIGDDNSDGYLDGVFVAMGQFPLTSLILPGAPFVQGIGFSSDVPISALDAALLATASARNSLRKYIELGKQKGVDKSTSKLLLETSAARLEMVKPHLVRALKDESTCKPHCGAIKAALEARDAIAAHDTGGEVAARLDKIDRLFQQLRAVHDAIWTSSKKNS